MRSKSRHKSSKAFSPILMGLEDRQLLSTYVVSNTFASGSGSLANAVQQSNLNPGLDTITFTSAARGQIQLSHQLDITDAVTISGPGAGLLAVSDSNGRVFETHNTVVTINGLTLSNSHAVSTDFTPGAGGDGGAIQVDGGVLNLNNDAFINNTATNRGGAIFNFYGTVNSTGNVYQGNTCSLFHGGAVYDSGVYDSRFDLYSGNSAGEGGGAVEVAKSIIGIDGVSGRIRNSVFVGNSAQKYGGAVSVDNASSLTLGGDVFLGNHSFDDGGALAVGSVNGPGSLAVVTGSTFNSNVALDKGGAVFSKDNLNLSGSTLQFNSAASGGAYYVSAAGFSGVGNTVDFNSQPETVSV